MKKTIGAYLLGERIFLHAKKGTQSVPILSEPIFEVHITESPQKIGELTRQCVDAYQATRDRYSRDDFKKTNDPLIVLSGTKNSKDFFSKVKNVPVNLIEDTLIFYPTVNKGWKNGFTWTEHPNIEISYSASDEELGKSLLRAFELSRID